jgi:hypothetical protein
MGHATETSVHTRSDVSEKHEDRHHESEKASREGQGPAPKKDGEKDSKKLEQDGTLPKVEIAEGAAGADAEMKPCTNSRTDKATLLEESKFSQQSLAIFDRVDGDHDGFLSDRELSAAMQDNSYVEQEAQTISALYKARHSLSKLDRTDEPNDNIGPVAMVSALPPEGKGVSRTDLAAYGLMQPGTREKVYGAGMAENIFNDAGKMAQVDKNGDGCLSKDEVLNAAAATTDDGDRKALAYMANNFDTINTGSWWGSYTISKAEMQEHNKELNKTDEGKVLSEVYVGLRYTADSQSEKANYQLYADSDPLKSITPEAIRQQSIGDCYFSASLAALAKSRPQDIQNMIKDNQDGTYTVTFPGDPDSPVTIKAPTQMELGLYNASSEHGIWANVIEKAFGEYRKAHSWTDWTGDRTTPTDAADGGGLNSEAMNLLSPHKSTDQLVWAHSDADVQNQIKEALNDSPPRMVTVGSYGKSDTEVLETGYPADHAYTVTGYREDENGNVFVQVRNPWGGEDKRGTSEMSMEDFRKTFQTLTVEPKD